MHTGKYLLIYCSTLPFHAVLHAAILNGVVGMGLGWGSGGGVGRGDMVWSGDGRLVWLITYWFVKLIMVHGTIFFCLSSLTTVNVAVLDSYRLFTDPWSSWDSFHSRCFMPWVRNNLPTKIFQHQILRIIVSMAPHVCKKFLFGFKYTVRKWNFCVLVHFVKRIVGLPLFVKHLWLDKN